MLLVASWLSFLLGNFSKYRHFYTNMPLVTTKYKEQLTLSHLLRAQYLPPHCNQIETSQMTSSGIHSCLMQGVSTAGSLTSYMSLSNSIMFFLGALNWPGLVWPTFELHRIYRPFKRCGTQLQSASSFCLPSALAQPNHDTSPSALVGGINYRHQTALVFISMIYCLHFYFCNCCSILWVEEEQTQNTVYFSDNCLL